MTDPPQQTSEADMLKELVAAIQDCDRIMVDKLNAIGCMDTHKFSGDDARALLARTEQAEAAARESAMQELASLGQAAEAYTAQLKAEAWWNEADELIKALFEDASSKNIGMAEANHRSKVAFAERDDLQAEVDRLLAAIQSIAANTCCDGCGEAGRFAQSVLKGNHR